jgi:RecT family
MIEPASDTPAPVALTVAEPRPAPTLMPATWQSLKDQAQVLVASGLLPDSIRSWQAAVAVMLQGRELGLGPMASFNGINVIRGRTALSAQLMLGLIQRSGLLANLELHPGVGEYTVVMQRHGQAPHAETYTLQMARDLGLGVGDARSQWSKQPQNMLKQRAISACARVVFPDVIAGLYTTEEATSFEDNPADYVEGDWAAIEEPPPPPADPDAAQRRLDSLFGTLRRSESGDLKEEK